MLQVWCQGKNPEAIEEEEDTLDALLFLNAWQRGRVTEKSVFSLESKVESDHRMLLLQMAS